MSFKAELSVEGKVYNVRRFFTLIHRKTDLKGRPTSMPQWTIALRIDAVDDTTLTSWMIDPTKQLDGKLTIYKIDQDTKLKEIQFKKSYCYFMRDVFQSDLSYASCEIHIGGKDIQINTASLKQNWPG